MSVSTLMVGTAYVKTCNLVKSFCGIVTRKYSIPLPFLGSDSKVSLMWQCWQHSTNDRGMHMSSFIVRWENV